MVIVKNYFHREGEKGEPYITLQLEGDMELVQSQKTGRFYATARTCNIYSTFDKPTAERMVGTEMPGKIVRVSCEPYLFTIPETGEVVELAHAWDYVPNEKARSMSIPVGTVAYLKS